MGKSKRYYIRKLHRYLGVILGLQFLMWTVSGLYFSWTDIDEIHGDFERRHPSHLQGGFTFTSPETVYAEVGYRPDSIHSIQIVSILDSPYYAMQFFKEGAMRKVLASATTGKPRASVSKEEAVKIASASFIGDPVATEVKLISATDGHHEYREKPLPAWAVTFDHPSSTTVYVSAETGKVESFRNNKWRLFDFLWMGHTMGYQSRDNINNWLLRIFSVFGLVTVTSGFALYFVSSRWRRRKMSAPGASKV